MLYLAQTDTTAGFLAQHQSIIARAKNRALQKPCVWTTARLARMREVVRVPQRFAARVRKSKHCTFIIKNRAVRVVFENPHAGFLEHFCGLYSSSANKAGEGFCESFATQAADIIVIEGQNPLCECAPSKIYKLNTRTIKRIR